eukprot:354406-Chlamydomonas_euryale.AAC.5
MRARGGAPARNAHVERMRLHGRAASAWRVCAAAWQLSSVHAAFARAPSVPGPKCVSVLTSSAMYSSVSSAVAAGSWLVTWAIRPGSASPVGRLMSTSARHSCFVSCGLAPGSEPSTPSTSCCSAVHCSSGAERHRRARCFIVCAAKRCTSAGLRSSSSSVLATPQHAPLRWNDTSHALARLRSAGLVECACSARSA